MPDSPIESPVVWGGAEHLGFLARFDAVAAYAGIWRTFGAGPTHPFANLQEALLPFACLLVLSLFTAACFTSQAKPAPRLFVPPPVQPRPVIPTAPPELSAGPDLDITVTVSLAEILELPMPDYPAPVKLPSTPRRPPPAKPAPEPTPAPPKITQYFSDEVRARYTQEYLSSQDRVTKNVASLESRRLTASQKQ
ncbi:MAG: hypothetical protein JO307_09800, partial [Bryobacterales bacterium]|nr:hypothetical protein [Bryobacterales bacterium]